jgi:Domain of unknown function (DUF4338)
MPESICYRGRRVETADIEFINGLIAQNPLASRRQLSAKLCEAWHWVQANGQLQDMVCRSLMLELHRAHLIVLPAKRINAINNVVQRRAPVADPKLQGSPLECGLEELGDIEFQQVRRTEGESLFGRLVQTYHYLGYTQPVGAHLKYLVYAGGQPIACMAWSSAPRHLGCRDRFIGWSQTVRRQNIHFIAYNTRFLILPWVKVEHLGSHLLGRMARLLSADWQRLYHYPIYLLETFVDPQRFAGTCYRASNWIYLGLSAGLGKNDQTRKQNRSLKALWVYPLIADFRRKLNPAHE